MKNILLFELFNIYDYLLVLAAPFGWDYAYYVLFSVVVSVFLIAIIFSGRAGKLIKDLTVGISAGLVGVDAGLRIWDRYDQNKKPKGTGKDNSAGPQTPSAPSGGGEGSNTDSKTKPKENK